MDLEKLDDLSEPDMWTFVRGRIVEAAVELDAAMRGLHAQLRGLDGVDALLGAPQNWTELADQCRKLIKKPVIEDDTVRIAIEDAITSATAAYAERNRHIHDLLATDISDELLPDPDRIRRQGDCYLIRLTKKENAPLATLVTIESAHQVVTDLVAAIWRMRAARGYLAGRTSWRSLLLGKLEGEWDGTANWTYGGDDDCSQ